MNLNSVPHDEPRSASVYKSDIDTARELCTDLPFDVLLARIELGPLVDIIPACIAPDAHGKHHAHLNLQILGLLPPRYLRRIKVRRVVLIQNLSFSHLALLRSPSNPTVVNCYY